jgi:hypothetical protein
VTEKEKTTLTDDEQKRAVEGILKAQNVVAQVEGVEGELTAGESLALAFDTVSDFSNREEWMHIAEQVDELPFKIRSAVADGSIPYNQAGIEADTSKMFGSPTKNLQGAVESIARASCDEALRISERRLQWSMSRLGALATVCAAVVGGGGLGYLIATLNNG